MAEEKEGRERRRKKESKGSSRLVGSLHPLGKITCNSMQLFSFLKQQLLVIPKDESIYERYKLEDTHLENKRWVKPNHGNYNKLLTASI